MTQVLQVGKESAFVVFHLKHLGRKRSQPPVSDRKLEEISVSKAKMLSEGAVEEMCALWPDCNSDVCEMGSGWPVSLVSNSVQCSWPVFNEDSVQVYGPVFPLIIVLVVRWDWRMLLNQSAEKGTKLFCLSLFFFFFRKSSSRTCLEVQSCIHRLNYPC